MTEKRKTQILTLMSREKSTTKEKLQKITLEEDMARVWTMLRHDIVKPDDVVAALCTQLLENSRSTIVQILFEQGCLSDQQLEMFQKKVGEKNIFLRESAVKMSDNDISLAESLIKYKVLAEEKVRELTKILSRLQKLEVACGLKELISKTKLVEEDVITRLLNTQHLKPDNNFLDIVNSVKEVKEAHQENSDQWKAKTLRLNNPNVQEILRKQSEEYLAVKKSVEAESAPAKDEKAETNCIKTQRITRVDVLKNKRKTTRIFRQQVRDSKPTPSAPVQENPKQDIEDALSIFNEIDERYEGYIKREETKEVVLDSGMATIWNALMEGMIDKSDISEAFLIQAFQSKKQKIPLVDIIRERCFLFDVQFEELRSQTKVVQKSKKMEISDADWELANYMIEYKVLAREEMQKLLSVLVNLHEFGIKYSLDTLIIESRLMNSEMVKALVDQCYRAKKSSEQTTSQKKNKEVDLDRIIISEKDESSWRGTVVALVACFCLVVSLGVALQYFPKDKKQQQVTAIVTPEESQEPTQPLVAKQVPKKDMPEKNAEQLRNEKGLIKWGNFWISEEQQKFLASHTVEGGHLRNVALRLYSMQAEYNRGKEIPSLDLQGKMRIPELPEKCEIQIHIQVFDALRKNIYAETCCSLRKDDFSTSLQFAKTLSPDFYSIRVAFRPSMQKELVSHLLDVKEVQEWWHDIRLGSKKQILDNYNEYQQKFTEINQRIEKQNTFIQDILAGKKVEQQEKLQFFTAIKALEGKIASLQQQLFASFEEETQRLPIFPDQMLRLFHVTTSEQSIVLATFEKHIELQIKTQKNIVDLQQKYQQMMEILKTSKADYVKWDD